MLDLDLHLALSGRPLQVRLQTVAPAVGLVGPSGAGKSTLIRVLVGAEPRATGTLRVFGETWQSPAGRTPAHQRGVGWVPQEALLFPHLNVAENLTFAGHDALDEVADLVELTPLLGRLPRHLSGGERQRVALGRALLARPRLLLLDEPFASLDRSLRERVRARLAGWCARERLPLVLVTHDEADLPPFGAEVWRVEGGQVTREHPG